MQGGCHEFKLGLLLHCVCKHTAFHFCWRSELQNLFRKRWVLKKDSIILTTPKRAGKSSSRVKSVWMWVIFVLRCVARFGKTCIKNWVESNVSYSRWQATSRPQIINITSIHTCLTSVVIAFKLGRADTDVPLYWNLLFSRLFLIKDSTLHA